MGHDLSGPRGLPNTRAACVYEALRQSKNLLVQTSVSETRIHLK